MTCTSYNLGSSLWLYWTKKFYVTNKAFISQEVMMLWWLHPSVYLESCWKSLAIFLKSSILDDWMGSEFGFAIWFVKSREFMVKRNSYWWQLVNHSNTALRKKCPYSELFWSVFSFIWTEYEEIRGVSPYSVRIREKEDHKNSDYGYFSHSGDVLNAQNWTGLIISSRKFWLIFKLFCWCSLVDELLHKKWSFP